ERSWESTEEEAAGNETVRFQRVSVVHPGKDGADTITTSTPFGIEVEYWRLSSAGQIFTDIVFYTEDGSPAFESISVDDNGSRDASEGAGPFRPVCRIPGGILNEGRYRIRIQFVDESSAPVLNLSDALILTVHDTGSREFAWYGRYYGPVHPRLEWKTEFLGTPLEKTAEATQ